MTDDPFGLRRFGFYSEQDIAVTRNLARQPAAVHSPDLDAFLAYWTPARIARAKREETTS